MRYANTLTWPVGTRYSSSDPILLGPYAGTILEYYAYYHMP